MKSRWSRREFLKTARPPMVLGAAEKALGAIASPRPTETPSRENRRNGFLHRLRLGHPVLLYSG